MRNIWNNNPSWYY